LAGTGWEINQPFCHKSNGQRKIGSGFRGEYSKTTLNIAVNQNRFSKWVVFGLFIKVN
jgi:hypothetical protein